jgi:predicted nucleic acid-binding protein
MLEEAERFRINLSVALVLEYEDVLKRAGKVRHLTAKDIDDFLDYLCSIGRLHMIHYLWRPQLRDPRDELVLELAVQASSDYIVTHNTKDFSEARRFGITAIKPQEFIRRIEAES